MWYGKLCIIFYLFAFAMLFSVYYINNAVFNDPAISNTQLYTSLSSLMTAFQPNIQQDPTLLFGDFIDALNVLKALIGGSLFHQVFDVGGVMTYSGFGGYDTALNFLITGLFDSATVFLFLYILSFRSI